jgi:hypothetical protein
MILSYITKITEDLTSIATHQYNTLESQSLTRSLRLHQVLWLMLNITTGMTPIRVRGKRTGTKAEKWNARKQRGHVHNHAVDGALTEVLSQASSVASHRTKRRRVALSRLEELPNEMIQAIFVDSGNLDLPLASRAIAAQLSGQQLQWELTLRTLAPIIHRADDAAATSCELALAARLLNSRFMTWHSFRQWLLHQAVQSDADHIVDPPFQPEPRDNEVSQYADIWTSLRLSPGFMPPAKVLRGPWTEDAVQFLRVFSLYPGGCTSPLDGIAAEVAYDGLSSAVQHASTEAISLLRNLHIQPDQELLRKAVIDYGCDRKIVLYLLQWCVTELLRWTAGPVNRETYHPRIVIDFLDPVLWAWAEKASAAGISTGGWLIQTLKRVSGVIADSEDTQDASDFVT